MSEPVKINELLLGMAMDDGAKRAAERELSRQILEQGGDPAGLVFVDLSVDCHLVLREVRLDGDPVVVV